jgi:hypothetical protein
MNGVIIVAPVDAEWAVRAEQELSSKHLLVARLYEATLLSLLLHAGGVRAVAIDSRIAAAAMRTLRACGTAASKIRVVLIHDRSTPPDASKSLPWPANSEAVRQLIGLS